MMKGKIKIVAIESAECVHTIDFEGGERRLDRVVSGLLRQMNLDVYFVDTDDVVEVEQEQS